MTHQVLDAAEARAIVWARCMGRCELCGFRLQPTAWEAHHRLPRSAGGTWCPCNVLGLHPRCHTQGKLAVHDHPALAYSTGHMVRRGHDPREVWMALPPGFLFATAELTCGGTYT